MSNEQIVLWVLGSLGAVGALLGALLKTIVPRIVDAKLANESLMTKAEVEAASYTREREVFAQDTTFELLKEALNYLLEETREDRKQQIDLIKAINRIAANVDQNTQVQRLIVQTLTKFDDRLERVERALNIEILNGREDG